MAVGAFSGAVGGVAGLLRVRRTARDGPLGPAAVAARFNAPVRDGGSLVCGRQLRPGILLENSPLQRRQILTPIASAASSPAEGSDSAG